MTASAPPVRHGRWWTRVVMVLLICITVPVTPQLRALFPVEQTLMLLASLIAVCMVIGWRQGGSPWRALFWLVVAAAMIAWPGPPAIASYGLVERGWTFESGN